MKEIILGTTGKKMPAIVVGCMRLADKNVSEMQRFLHSALEQGAYFFDHADIYGGGQSETIFGEAMAKDSSISVRSCFCSPNAASDRDSLIFPRSILLVPWMVF